MPVSNSAKEKVQATPKELLRRGLLTGTEKLQGQLRDAAEGGQREETEVERAQNSAQAAAQQAGNQMKRSARRKKKARTGKPKSSADVDGACPDVSASGIQMKQGGPSGSAEPEPVAINTAQLERRTSHTLQQGREEFAHEQQRNVTDQRMGKQCGSERTVPARQKDTGGVQPRHSTTLYVPSGKRPAGNAARGTVSNGKRRIKEVPSGTKAVGRFSKQAVKGAESSGKALKAGGRSVQTARQTAQSVVQAQQRAVQAANTAQRVAKAAAAALRGAAAAVRSLAPLLAAGGGTVFAVVLVLCMAGAILASPLGIFFSFFGGNSGGQQQTTITISAVVQELNQEYDARLDEIRANASYDEESLTGSPAPWSEVLAVYAVKTAADPANEQEVVTMDDEKKELLKQIFWDMNELSSFTSTIPGEGGEGDTTTLYITVTAKTADEMAEIYSFNDDQRQQLAELLSDRYREMWNDVF